MDPMENGRFIMENGWFIMENLHMDDLGVPP
jgi:hypothetical protein